MDTPPIAPGGGTRLTLEGSYTPPNYLEEPVAFERPDYSIKVGDGCIEVAFRDPDSPPSADRQAAVERDLHQVFTARLILTGQPWEMSELRLHRRYPDGRKDVWLSVSSGFVVLTGSPADFIHRDAEGNVIRDTRAER